MPGKSAYLEGQYLTHELRTGSFTKPAGIYVALLTAAPSDAGGGTECAGGNYARVQNGPSDAAWSAPAGTPRACSNDVPVAFPVPSANWGQATHFGLYDAAVAGNLLRWGALAAPKNINNGDPAPTFPVGTLVLSED